MSGNRDTSPVVIHAFFGALISVVAAVVLAPFFGELAHLALMMGTLALAFVFLNVGFTPVGSTPLAVSLLEVRTKTGSIRVMSIRVPFIVIVIALLILGLLLPWEINLANKAIIETNRIEASTRYVFLILGAIYILSVPIYNGLVRVLGGSGTVGRGGS
jgi:hypothetical protein